MPSPATASRPQSSARHRRADASPPRPDWWPRWHSPSLYTHSDGPAVSLYASTFLHVSKGMLAGQPLVFADWQDWLADRVLERRPNGRRRYRRGLIGLARKNGKSLFGSAVALHGLTESLDAAEIYACAGDRQQARIVFNEAKWQVLNSPSLLSIVKVYRDVLEVPSTGSIFRVLSADAKLQQGLNPSLVIFDEVHVQPNDDLWDAMTQGSGARLDPLVLGITTAGHDLDSLLGRLYRYGCALHAGEVEDPTFGMWWWEPHDPAARHTDELAWRQANPNLACGLLDLEDLQSASQPGATSEFAFRRFRLNQWVRAEESWLPSGAWEACEGEPDFDPDLPCWVGIDMALKHDSIAVVVAQPQPDGRIHVQARLWFPKGNTVDVAGVEAHLRQLHLALNVREFAYDPAYFERSAQALADDGLPMLEFPQSAARMVPACQTGYSLICAGSVVHAGIPSFTDQVLAAAVRQTDDGWRLSKGKSRRKIDGAIALVIALHRATGHLEVPPPPATTPTDPSTNFFRPSSRLSL